MNQPFGKGDLQCVREDHRVSELFLTCSGNLNGGWSTLVDKIDILQQRQHIRARQHTPFRQNSSDRFLKDWWRPSFLNIAHRWIFKTDLGPDESQISLNCINTSRPEIARCNAGFPISQREIFISEEGDKKNVTRKEWIFRVLSHQHASSQEFLPVFGISFVGFERLIQTFYRFSDPFLFNPAPTTRHSLIWGASAGYQLTESVVFVLSDLRLDFTKLEKPNDRDSQHTWVY